MPEPAVRELVLYGTLGCHLCEQAEQLLLPWAAEGWQIEQVDIADDDALLAQYASLIPVLLHSHSQRSLNWPFDEFSLSQFLVRVSR